MTSIIMTSKGMDATDRILTGLSDGLEANTWKLFHKLMEDIVFEARSILQTNTNIDSGTLLANIRILEENEAQMSGRVGTDLQYAIWIEFGRGPVRPLDPDGWLHWIDKDTGDDVFAKFANATEASPFLQPAVIKHTKKFQDVWVDFYIPEMKSLL